MPWGIIAIPVIACLVYGFLLGLKSIDVYEEYLREKMEESDEDRDRGTTII